MTLGNFRSFFKNVFPQNDSHGPYYKSFLKDTEKQDEPVINIQETGNNEMSDDHSDIAENNDENRALIPGMYEHTLKINFTNFFSTITLIYFHHLFVYIF